MDSLVHILILGSGYETDERLSYCSQLNASGLARLTEGMRLHRILLESKIILSGSAGNNPLPEAVVEKMGEYGNVKMGEELNFRDSNKMMVGL